MTYNGWTNWETWMVFSHLSNDERMYEDMREIVSGYVPGYGYMQSTGIRSRAEELRGYVWDIVTESETVNTTGIVGDLISAAFYDWDGVNWVEIVENVQSDMDDGLDDWEDEDV